ncbi:MAG TPA: phage holin family protein [Nitriliruptoraceae bacterium]|nr:phage holin family protein [Nitriliruptoraceae bacterium]
MNLLIRLAANAAGVYLGVRLVDGLTFDGSWQSMVIIVIVMAMVNALVKPIAKLVSLPLVVVTLGLFLLVINAAMLALVIWLTGDLGLHSDGFGATFLGAVVISIVSWLATAILDRDD